jgi:SMC interacting uncharacterized protein involved in chromosome segregation
MDDYDVNDQRIKRIEYILDELPRIEERIDRINAQIGNRDMTVKQFRDLVSERSTLVKRYDELNREAKENYRLVTGKEKGKITYSTEGTI